MTGPEHYREAERLLGMAHHWTYGDGGDATVGAALAAEAGAHATLALAAATAEVASVQGTANDVTGLDLDAWYATCGTQPVAKEG